MAIITVDIDDHTYEHALALFNFRGQTAEEAIKELFERASYDEYANYEHLKPNEETLAAMQECEDILSGKISAKGYTDVDEMVRDILEDDDDD